VSHAEHRATAPRSIRCVVLTVSDTRTEATDTAGRAIVELLVAAGHVVIDRRLSRDEPAEVQAIVAAWLDRDDLDAVITTGGTGITSRDSTFEAISSLLAKSLPGFGELFRMLSYQEIGPAAMLSRAQAGTRAGRLVFSLPGSPAACRLALERLILPELGHLVREVNR
jgi:molybdenum cofactor biosynthesis protein B